VLDLNAVANRGAAHVAPLIGEDITLRLALAPELGRTRADRGQIEQVS
jgi:hypothetical protein